MESLLQDIRYSCRSLAKSSGFTALVILILAVGIGANGAVFSIIDRVLLRPLPFESPERLVRIWETQLQQGWERFSVSLLNFLDWRAQSRTLEMAAFQAHRFNLTGAGEPEAVMGALCSADLLSVLGVEPLRGRSFTAAEERSGGAHVALIGYDLWRRRFSGDEGIIGKPVTLDGETHTIVGVMPPRFAFPDLLWAAELNAKAQIWAPLVLDAPGMVRESHALAVIARLHGDSTLEQARTELGTISDRLARGYPASNTGWGVYVESLHETVVGNVRVSLLVLAGAVAMVLLIACANVANLLLARSASRNRELALRTALGASRRRLIRQMMAESLMLALAGGALGLLLARWSLALLAAAALERIPRIGEVGVDGRVLAWSLAMAVATGLLIGILPTARVSRLNLHDSLKQGSGRTTGAPVQRLRALLVVSEFALALVLLAGAGLMIRSFLGLQRVNPGFDPENLLLVDLQLSETEYAVTSRRGSFYREVLRRVAEAPGVEAVGGIQAAPLSGRDMLAPFKIEGRGSAQGRETPFAEYRSVSSAYLRAMRIPLLRGRPITDQDREDTPGVVLISESMAKQFWPGSDPIGQRLTIVYEAPNSREIIGVVGDVRYLGLASGPDPTMYVPFPQSPLQILPSFTLAVRTGSDPASAAAAVRSAVREVHRTLPITLTPMEQRMVAAMARTRFSMAVLGAFAAVALTLAAVGLYGVIAYSVAQRRREIGIRMALGARSAEIRAMVVRQGLMTALWGLGIGVVAAMAATRALASLTYGVGATDPVTFACASLLLLGIAVLASYLPARAATRVDPMITLRSD